MEPTVGHIPLLQRWITQLAASACYWWRWLGVAGGGSEAPRQRIAEWTSPLDGCLQQVLTYLHVATCAARDLGWRVLHVSLRCFVCCNLHRARRHSQGCFWPAAQRRAAAGGAAPSRLQLYALAAASIHGRPALWQLLWVRAHHATICAPYDSKRMVLFI